MFVTVYFLCSLVSSYADLSQYDQRQTGDFNVQVDLKDVQIFGILKGDKEEYVDYDYAYDYSELTIKPQHGTSPKPHATGTNASTQQPVTRDNSTTAATALQEHTIAPVHNELTTLFTASTVALDKDDSATTVANYPHITSEHNVGIRNVTAAPTAGPTRRNCRKGYILNKKPVKCVAGHAQCRVP